VNAADRLRRDLANLFGPNSVQLRDLEEALEEPRVTTPNPAAPPRPRLFDVIEVFDDGSERVIAEGRTEDNAEAIVAMAVMRRGVEHSHFTTRAVGDDPD
jgi:hypothetical protein